MNEICWLPELEYLVQYENIWSIYESALYSIFKSDFIDSYPLYKNTRVNVKHYPIEYGKEEAFFHTTCKDYTGNGVLSRFMRKIVCRLRLNEVSRQ